MRHRLIAVMALSLGAGCTSRQLSRNTISQASTLSDLQFQQVVNNLAMFAGNPSAIPYHVSLKDGSAQVADSGSGAFAFAFGRAQGYLATYAPSLNAQRTIVDSWAMAPITDDNELQLLSLAYRRAFGSSDTLDTDDFANDLAHELKKQVAVTDDFRLFNDVLMEQQRKNLKKFDVDVNPLLLYDRLDETTIASNDERIIVPGEHVELKYQFSPASAVVFSKTGSDKMYTDTARSTAVTREARRLVRKTEQDIEDIPVLWFGVGCRKKDVPPDACYVGHYKDKCGERYVWVCPQNRDQLKKFTLTILGLSTLLQESQLVTSTGGPRSAPASAYIPLAPTRAR
ncbi:hypothetical protein SAMN05444166_3929 [Singulisphaera sp. GP187]|uniref:hypothetical protein n=1 Tax=Singulisphaera sp. GP187 TaxID=1882752 RepID=UPI00092C2CA5|nr:hypothetical protein [Singulisphaera sp. GP187]SIO34186.1 hypothetical protein SAMN05444166_3929 [Singulisphaera sp. GP187]